MENMEYNTQLDKMIIPEYGRNIQSMINHCCTIENRDERNNCARAIIQVMGQLNPHLRDIADFTHKLWDHLFIISEFKLDVDSPYPLPSAETFITKPEIVSYPSGRIKYKHYGKTIEAIIEKAKKYEEGPEKEELKRTIANNLKRFYINWNKDSITDEIILGHLKELSEGALTLDSSVVLSSSNELRIPKPNTPSAGSNQKHKYQNNKNKNNKFKQNNRKY